MRLSVNSKMIGLDLGTTNVKAVLMDLNGAICGTASSSYGLRSPQPGWSEQDPREAWIAVQAALKLLASQNSLQGVEGLCLSGAMQSLFPMDKTGQPLANAMSWADQRAAPEVDALRQAADPKAVYRRNGCPLNAYYYPARLRWWTGDGGGRLPGARYTSIKDWVLMALTGRWVTDYSLASSTGLLNIWTREYDPEAIKLAGVTRSQLSELVSPTAVVGKLGAEAARLTGLPPGLPVVAGASDGGLANLGSGAVNPGEMVITVGTSGAVRRILGQPWLDPLARTWCYVLLEDRWFCGGAINSAGLAVQWAREKFYSDLTPETGVTRLMEDAGKIDAGSDGLFFLPYFAGERSPHWNPSLRASLHGLSLEHQRGHLARALLEGVAYCLRDVWDVLTQDLPQVKLARLTGGITQSAVWSQIVADVIGVPMLPIEAADASAIGAGMLGAYGLGLVEKLGLPPDPSMLQCMIYPDTARHASYLALHQNFRDIFNRENEPL